MTETSIKTDTWERTIGSGPTLTQKYLWPLIFCTDTASPNTKDGSWKRSRDRMENWRKKQVKNGPQKYKLILISHFISFHSLLFHFLFYYLFILFRLTVEQMYFIKKLNNSIALVLYVSFYVRFHSSWLRINCQCSECCQKHSSQRTLNVAKLPKNISLAHVNLSGKKIKIFSNEIWWYMRGYWNYLEGIGISKRGRGVLGPENVLCSSRKCPLFQNLRDRHNHKV